MTLLNNIEALLVTLELALGSLGAPLIGDAAAGFQPSGTALLDVRWLDSADSVGKGDETASRPAVVRDGTAEHTTSGTSGNFCSVAPRSNEAAPRPVRSAARRAVQPDTSDRIDDLQKAAAEYDAAKKAFDTAKNRAQKQLLSDLLLRSAAALATSAEQFLANHPGDGLEDAIAAVRGQLLPPGDARSTATRQLLKLTTAARVLSARSRAAATRADSTRRTAARTADSIRKSVAEAEAVIDSRMSDYLVRNPPDKDRAVILTRGGKPERVGPEHGALAIQLAMAYEKLVFERSRESGLVTAYARANPGELQASIGEPFEVDLKVTRLQVAGNCARIQAARAVAERLREVFRREQAAPTPSIGEGALPRIGSRSRPSGSRDSTSRPSASQVAQGKDGLVAMAINPVFGAASLILGNREALARLFKSKVDYDDTGAALRLPAGVRDISGGSSSAGDRLQITRIAFGEFQQQLKRFEKIQADMDSAGVSALSMAVVNENSEGYITVSFDSLRYAQLVALDRARAAVKRDEKNKKGTRELLAALEQKRPTSNPIVLRQEAPPSEIVPGRDVSTLQAAASMCTINDAISKRLFPSSSDRRSR
jgi:hypothetical protein